MLTGFMWDACFICDVTFKKCKVDSNELPQHVLMQILCLFNALRPSKQLWSCWDVTSNFVGLLNDTSNPVLSTNPVNSYGSYEGAV